MARNRHTPPSVLSSLAFAPEKAQSRWLVAQHPHTPLHTLQLLADSDDRGSVADNPNAPAALLDRIAKTYFADLEQHEATTWDVQDAASFYASVSSAAGFASLAKSLAAHPNTPPHVLQTLLEQQYGILGPHSGLEDDADGMLERLARNPALPLNGVRLLRDRCGRVRYVVDALERTHADKLRLLAAERPDSYY